MLLFYFLLPIKMQCVFATLRDNLFSSSHVFSDSRYLLPTLLMVEIEFEEKEIPVSSAYILATEALSFRGKSLCRLKQAVDLNRIPVEPLL